MKEPPSSSNRGWMSLQLKKLLSFRSSASRGQEVKRSSGIVHDDLQLSSEGCRLCDWSTYIISSLLKWFTQVFVWASVSECVRASEAAICRSSPNLTLVYQRHHFISRLNVTLMVRVLIYVVMIQTMTSFFEEMIQTFWSWGDVSDRLVTATAALWLADSRSSVIGSLPAGCFTAATNNWWSVCVCVCVCQYIIWGSILWL